MTQAATLAGLAASGAIATDSSGNVGIGTTSPTSYSSKTLQVTGSSTTTAIKLTNSTTGSGNDAAFDFELNGNDINYVNRTSTGAQKFWTNSLERARLDSSGNFIFRYVTATAPWDQNSAGNGAYTWLGNSTYPLGICNQNNIVGIFNRYQGNGVVIEIKNGTTVVGSISHNGSNTAYNTSSDYRLKENVQPMTGALAKVAALKPCTYTWKTDGSAGEGFIAHELAEVFPGAVTGEKDALKEDGSINPQGIDTSFLVATLTAAIQELKAEVDQLRAQLEAK